MRLATTACVALLTALTAGPSSAQHDSTTLYHRIGGYDVLARFVDIAFPRVASHPHLQRLFRGHSRDSQVRQRQLILDALCQATGGPCAYIGRELATVHLGLEITDADWEAFIGIIASALDELEVPGRARADFLELFERGFRPAVVIP